MNFIVDDQRHKTIVLIEIIIDLYSPARPSLHSDNIIIMPRRAYLVFGDIEGKLDVLRVECTKCARKGRYNASALKAGLASRSTCEVRARRQRNLSRHQKFFCKNVFHTKATPFIGQNHFWTGFWERGA